MPLTNLFYVLWSKSLDYFNKETCNKQTPKLESLMRKPKVLEQQCRKSFDNWRYLFCNNIV